MNSDTARVVLSASGEICDEIWIGDSGASGHMTRDEYMLTEYEKFEASLKISVADGNSIEAIGKGSVNCVLFDGKEWKEGTITEVLHVPGIQTNLLSFGQLRRNGFDVHMDHDVTRVVKNNKAVIIGEYMANGLPRMRLRVVKEITCYATETSRLWHERLAHISTDTIAKMSTQKIVTGMNLVDSTKFFCGPCQLGKMTKKPYKNAEKMDVAVGERMHADLCGPISVATKAGSIYSLVIKDEKSKYRRVFYLRRKSEVVNCFEEFIAEMRAERNEVFKVLRSDNGTEFVNTQMKTLLLKNGIVHETTAPYNPQQNGFAEQENRNLWDHARASMSAKDLPKYLWAEAVNCTAEVLNCVPATGQEMTPKEMWTGKKPNISHFRVFGTKGYVHTPKELRQKIDSKATMQVFVGYTKTSKNFKMWDPNSGKIGIYRDVQFDPLTELSQHAKEGIEIANLNSDEEQTQNLQVESDCEDTNTDDKSKDFQKVRGRPKGSRNRVYEKVDRNLRSQHRVMIAQLDQPMTYEDAMNSPDKLKWIASMEEEKSSLIDKEVYEIVEMPPDLTPKDLIDSRWVFKIKEHPDGTVNKYKSRLVAKGFKQRYGVNFKETYAPVCKLDSVRVILAICNELDLDFVHLDVETAFLHGDLKEAIYMRPPPGCEENTTKVWRLKKSLYGLKQASREWNIKFDSAMKEFGFKRMCADRCVYVMRKGSKLLILVLYVDDGLLCGSDMALITEVINFLKQRFEIKIEDPDCFIGFQIVRNRESREIKIHQAGYIRRVLERFNMEDSKAIATPADVGLKLIAVDDDELEVKFPYKEELGALMHAMVMTCTDIAFAVGAAARFMHKPGKQHVIAVRNILRYLKGTINSGIVYRAKGSLNLVGFTDSDYAGDHMKRKSTSGYVFLLGDGAVSWRSKLQPVQALSTCEAEYVAAADAAKQVIWLRLIMQELGLQQHKATVLNCDNQGSIQMIKNGEVTDRAKHIDIKHHFIVDRVEEEVIKMEYVDTKNQAADIYTKALSKSSFMNCLKMISFK